MNKIDLKKVEAIINSCTTDEQLHSCFNFIDHPSFFTSCRRIESVDDLYMRSQILNILAKKLLILNGIKNV